MTCIIGLIDRVNNKILMGGDGCSGDASTYFKFTVMQPKVFKRSRYIIGGTTSFRMLNLLECSGELPTPPDNPKELFKFLVNDFVDAIRKIFKDNGFSKKNNEREEGGDFLIGVNNRLFNISNDYQVSEPEDDFFSVGCGRDCALASLFTTSKIKKMTSHSRIELALRSASKYSAFVSKPFTIIEKTWS